MIFFKICMTLTPSGLRLRGTKKKQQPEKEERRSAGSGVQPPGSTAHRAPAHTGFLLLHGLDQVAKRFRAETAGADKTGLERCPASGEWLQLGNLKPHPSKGQKTAPGLTT